MSLAERKAMIRKDYADRVFTKYPFIGSRKITAFLERRVPDLAHKGRSNTLKLCSIMKYGKPEIMNTDQGSQFTGKDWNHILTNAKIKISMDGRGRSLKQEAVYLHELLDGFQARRVIKVWIGFYHTERPHSALEKQTQDHAYFREMHIRQVA